VQAACGGQAWSWCCTKPKADWKGYAPPDPCKCKSAWSYNNTVSNALSYYCNGECDNPDNGARPWCYTEGVCNGQTWSYCSSAAPPTCSVQRSQFREFKAPSGCACKQNWDFQGKYFCNGECEAPDDGKRGCACMAIIMCSTDLTCMYSADINGPWCYTEAACAGKGWAYCVKPSSTPAPSTPPATTPSGGGATSASTTTWTVEMLLVTDYAYVCCTVCVCV